MRHVGVFIGVWRRKKAGLEGRWSWGRRASSEPTMQVDAEFAHLQGLQVPGSIPELLSSSAPQVRWCVLAPSLDPSDDWAHAGFV